MILIFIIIIIITPLKRFVFSSSLGDMAADLVLPLTLASSHQVLLFLLWLLVKICDFEWRDESNF